MVIQGARPTSGPPNTYAPGYKASLGAKSAPPRPTTAKGSIGGANPFRKPLPSNGAPPQQNQNGSSGHWRAEEGMTFDQSPPDEPAYEEPPVQEEHIADEEVPEHLKEAVEGSFKLKRAIAQQVQIGTNKRRKLDTSAARDISAEDADKIKQLLLRFRLENDVASRYVLEALNSLSLDNLIRDAGWRGPNPNDQRKSVAELIADRALYVKEQNLIHGMGCDAVAAFKFRWQLADDEYKLLCSLNHKDLRYALREYDGTRPVIEIVEEAKAAVPEGSGACDAAPYRPGISTLSRFVRLELIDPFADALVCGDANLTFALHLALHRKVLGHVGRIVATTFEKIEILQERYKEIDDTIHQLEEHHAEVWHEVDCTRIAIDARFRGHEDTFGAVYYNYPHAGAVRGFFDAHPFVRWRHENLMHLFFRALRAFVKPGGQVKVASNAGATGVRYSDIIDAAAVNEFAHTETFPFNDWQLKGYHRSYGDKRDAKQRPDEEGYRAQNADKDMVYSFCYAPTGDPVAEVPVKMPPTCRELMDSTSVCGCGFICQFSMTRCERNQHHFKPSGHHKEATPPQKEKTIMALYDRFLSEVQGQHIG